MSDDLRKKLGGVDISKRFLELMKYRVPSGIIAIDRITGGGIPAGKLTEAYGDYSTGKTRLAMHYLAMTQKLGGIAVYLDNERALDKGLVDLTNIDVDALIYPDPDKKLDSIESVFGIIEEVMEYRQEFPDTLLTLVWDSVAATPGLEDLENELGMNTAAMRRAKVISDGLKKVMADVYKTKTCLFFVNQIRDKIGVMYGEKVDTVGGKALKFAASLRLHVYASGKIKNEQTSETVGMHGKVIVDKSRVCPPFGMVTFEMLIDKPISKYAGLFDYMERHGEIVKLEKKMYHFVESGSNDFDFKETDFEDAYEKFHGRKKK